MSIVNSSGCRVRFVEKMDTMGTRAPQLPPDHHLLQNTATMETLSSLPGEGKVKPLHLFLLASQFNI